MLKQWIEVGQVIFPKANAQGKVYSFAFKQRKCVNCTAVLKVFSLEPGQKS